MSPLQENITVTETNRMSNEKQPYKFVTGGIGLFRGQSLTHREKGPLMWPFKTGSCVDMKRLYN